MLVMISLPFYRPSTQTPLLDQSPLRLMKGPTHWSTRQQTMLATWGHAPCKLRQKVRCQSDVSFVSKIGIYYFLKKLSNQTDLFFYKASKSCVFMLKFGVNA